MSIESGEVHDWPPVTSAHASRGQPDATRSLAVRPVASIQSALLTARDPLTAASGVAFSDPLRFKPTHSDSLHSISFTFSRCSSFQAGMSTSTSAKIQASLGPSVSTRCSGTDPPRCTLQAADAIYLQPAALRGPWWAQIARRQMAYI